MDRTCLRIKQAQLVPCFSDNLCMGRLSLVLIISLLLILFNETAWSQASGLQTLEYTTTFNIKENGSYTISKNEIYKIVADQGINTLGQYTIPFQDDIEKVKIWQVDVINGDAVKKMDMDLHKVLEAPKFEGDTNSKVQAFALADIRPGTIVVFKYDIIRSKPIVKGSFSTEYYFGGSGAGQAEKLKVISKLPLKSHVNDPFGIFKWEEVKKGKDYVYQLSQVKNFPNNKSDISHGWVDLSTFDNWEDFRKIFMKDFEAKLKLPLPAFWKSNLSQAQQLATEREKIQWVVDTVHKNLKLNKNWLVNDLGAFTFSTPEEITKRKIGDSKDFALMMSKLLQELSITYDVVLAHPDAWSSRRLMKRNLPAPQALTSILIKAGSDIEKPLWLDPTLETDTLALGKLRSSDWYSVSMSHESSKPTLIAGAILDGELKVNVDQKLMTDEKMAVDIALHSDKDLATSSKIHENLNHVSSYLQYSLNYVEDPNFKIDLTKIASPNGKKINTTTQFEVTYKTALEKIPAKSSDGEYKIKLPVFPDLPLFDGNRDYNLVPNSITMTYKYDGFDIENETGTDCYTENPWFHFSQTTIKNDTGFEVIQNYKPKTLTITKLQTEQPEYVSMAWYVQQCLSKEFVTVKKIEPTANRLVLEKQISLDYLNKIKFKDFPLHKRQMTLRRIALELLKKNPDEDAAHVALSQFYLNMANQFSPPIEVYKNRAKEIIIAALSKKPESPALRTQMGLMMAAEGQLPAAAKEIYFAHKLDPKNPDVLYALAQYSKIKNEPLNYQKWLSAFIFAAKNDEQKTRGFYELGLSLQSENKTEDSLKAYTKAIELSPNYIEALGQATIVAAQLKKYDVGIKLGKKYFEASSEVPFSNVKAFEENYALCALQISLELARLPAPKEDDIKQAELLANESKKYLTNSALPLLSLGLIREHQANKANNPDKMSEAINFLLQAEKLAPENIDILKAIPRTQSALDRLKNPGRAPAQTK